MKVRVPRRFSFTRPGSLRDCLKRNESLRDAKKIDENKNGTISKQELAKYIETNAKLWAMLSVNLNLPEQKCRAIATDVAYLLAKQIKSENVTQVDASEIQREPSVEELSGFLDFIKTPKGEHEFFHRTVFQAFDRDGNGYLDYDELDQFLDIFYKAGSIFAGDARLPSKFQLKLEVLVQFDSNGDGRLDFQEIRSLISGGAQTLTPP